MLIFVFCIYRIKEESQTFWSVDSGTEGRKIIDEANLWRSSMASYEKKWELNNHR
jgi:hypothetical protein